MKVSGEGCLFYCNAGNFEGVSVLEGLSDALPARQIFVPGSGLLEC
jgi:hypothetical protein